MAWLTYYFSMERGTLRTCMENGLYFDSLLSYAYIKNTDKGLHDAHELIGMLRKRGKKTMLDSGGFTNFQKPGTVKLEEYLEYLKSEAGRWTEYITLDDPFSREKTLSQHQVLLRAGLRPLFVDHLKKKDDPRVDSIWKKDQKLCLSAWGTLPNQGGVSVGDNPQGNVKGKAKEAVDVRMSARAELARKVKTRTHLLAISSLTRFLPHLDIVSSVDSASWGRKPGFGEMVVMEFKDIGGLKVPTLKAYDHTGTLKPRKPAPPEVKRMARDFVHGRKWTVDNERRRIEFFCIDQIMKYVDAMNKLAPASVMAAFAKFQEERKQAKKSFVFFDDLEVEPWGEQPTDAVLASAESVVVDVALEKADALVEQVEVEKRLALQLFRSPFGKTNLAKGLIATFPEHKAYVEPFAGGAATFWAKEKSEAEVLNDIDLEFAKAYRFIRDCSPAELEKLKRKDWKVSEEQFNKLKALDPVKLSDLENFYRMAYLTFGSFMGNARSVDKNKVGRVCDVPERFQKSHERMKGVKVHNNDYQEVMTKYDSPDTFFFLDPPYQKAYTRSRRFKDFDHSGFWKFLSKIKGKILVTYDAKPEGSWHVKKLVHTAASSNKGPKEYTTFLISNYPLTKPHKNQTETGSERKETKKGTPCIGEVQNPPPVVFLEDGICLQDVDPLDLALESASELVADLTIKKALEILEPVEVEPEPPCVMGGPEIEEQLQPVQVEEPEVEPPDMEKDVRLLPVEKQEDGNEEQIVFGVVLEPNTEDSQGDTISPDEIKDAAHKWLAKFQNRGLMHKKLVNSKIEIFESYLAPMDMSIGGERVKKGTWLLMYHILDSGLWNDIKTKKLTGFSIGGFARRVRQGTT